MYAFHFLLNYEHHLRTVYVRIYLLWYNITLGIK